MFRHGLHIPSFALPVFAGRETSANGLKVFEGAFACCNFAQQAQSTDDIPEAGFQPLLSHLRGDFKPF